MAYNNVSYKEAIEILEGSEDSPIEVYDRFERPGKQSAINRERQNLKQNRKPTYKDKVITEQKEKEMKIIKEIIVNEKQVVKIYRTTHQTIQLQKKKIRKRKKERKYRSREKTTMDNLILEKEKLQKKK